jgi:hypothetical protein
VTTPDTTPSGLPPTNSYRRFLALRESGYRGPINENGYKADESNTDAEVLALLRALRDLP